MLTTNLSEIGPDELRTVSLNAKKFEMKERESIADMHQRFNVILNNLQYLGKKFSREKINGNIFETLTNDYDGKIYAITDARDIRTIPLQELIGSLKAEEEVIAYKKAKRKNKKYLALVAAKAERLIEMNELVMLAKNFKKLLEKHGK
ncbi:hypothetical protein LIER_40387 [Lithospermum erythrorhizon]|uniref:Uncharacterized protein n=1 Tax=Lithospermum erythrorhizon TaxID=34254 RepID=A0AAV3QV44_LITER